MSPRGHSAQTHRPYLSTAELLKLTGVTRKTLRVYEEVGICTPAHVGSEYYKYWTLEQASDIRLAQMMSRNGMTLGEIADSLKLDDGKFVAKAREQAIDSSRKQRRELKALALRSRAIEDFSSIGNNDGVYLRYIPQRWFALIPFDARFYMTKKGSKYIEAYERLRSICEIVGWAASDLHGVTSEVNAGGEIAASYLYLELASPPMPVPTGPRPIDCGCYQAFTEEPPSPACDRTRCPECALFGRAPTEEELARVERDRAHARKQGVSWHERVVMTSELTKAYISGPWSAYTKHALGDMEASGHGLALRPRLMPQEVALPYGVTACSLPAGSYLCRQASGPDEDGELLDFIRTLEELDTCSVREQDESETLVSNKTPAGIGHELDSDASSKGGVFPEPFSVMDSNAGSTQHAGPLSLDSKDLETIRLKTNTGLSPETPFLIIDARTPFGRRRDEIRKEFEALVMVD